MNQKTKTAEAEVVDFPAHDEPNFAQAAGGAMTVIENESVAASLSSAEINQQIATAKRYPRSLQKFRTDAKSMVTLTEGIARECIYALPRDGKTIEGPSARFGEIIMSAWGNCRAGARVIATEAEFVTAQGVFQDLERNSAVSFEVRRRIVDKRGNRYSHDMIGVTSNAASSIALRNAILRGVPKAFWSDLYEAARNIVKGKSETLAHRRDAAFKEFMLVGLTPENLFSILDIRGPEDIDLEKLVVLAGMLTAIKEGDTTPEQLLAAASGEDAAPAKPAAKKADKKPAPTPQEQVDPDTGEVKESEPPPADKPKARGKKAAAPQPATEPPTEPAAEDAVEENTPPDDDDDNLFKS